MAKIVYTSGSWDLFHVGHLNVLQKSKALGDELIVGVSTDALIEDYKGEPPVIPYEERFRIIEALKCVDKVVKQEVLTDIDQLKSLNVDVVTIGDDWKGRYLAGLDWMEQHGEVVYLPYTQSVSSTGLKLKIIENAHALIAASLERERENIERWKAEQEKAKQKGK